eukprot:591546-Amphidinium_carterae.2
MCSCSTESTSDAMPAPSVLQRATRVQLQPFHTVANCRSLGEMLPVIYIMKPFSAFRAFPLNQQIIAVIARRFEGRF